MKFLLTIICLLFAVSASAGERNLQVEDPSKVWKPTEYKPVEVPPPALGGVEIPNRSNVPQATLRVDEPTGLWKGRDPMPRVIPMPPVVSESEIREPSRPSVAPTTPRAVLIPAPTPDLKPVPKPKPIPKPEPKPEPKPVIKPEVETLPEPSEEEEVARPTVEEETPEPTQRRRGILKQPDVDKVLDNLFGGDKL